MTTQNNTHPDNIDIAKLLTALLDNKFVILITTLVFLLGGYLFAKIQTPIYIGDALVQIEKKSGGLSSLVSSDLGDLMSQESTAATEIELIKSRMVLGQVVDSLQLTTYAYPQYSSSFAEYWAKFTNDKASIDITNFQVNPDASQQITLTVLNADMYQLTDANDRLILEGMVGTVASSQDYKLLVESITAEEGATFVLGKANRNNIIGWLQGALSITEKGRGTGLLTLSMRDADTHKIVEVLDSVSEHYLLQNVQRQSAELQKSLVFLNEQLPHVKANLNDSELKLNKFLQENNTVDLDSEAASILQVMVDLESQLNELTFKESEISKRFTKDHPAYIALLEKRQILKSRQKQLEGQIQKLPTSQREKFSLMRDTEVNQQVYLQLLNKSQELQILKAGTVGNVRIVDRAITYSGAVAPKKLVIIALAAILGLILSIGYALLKAALNRGIVNQDDIEALELSVFTSVPKSVHQAQLEAGIVKKNKSKADGNLHLLAAVNPADLSIEALRALRTSLHFAMLEAKNNIIAISGPAPGIGKSFISSNFAAVMAQAGSKVLLIDADMRKGHIADGFGLHNKNGLSELLVNEQSLEQVVHKDLVKNLDVITRGVVPPNPSELLMHASFTQLLESQQEHYDYIIIDTPPILAVTDPAIIGRHAGALLMVAKFDATSSHELQAAKTRFEHNNIAVNGVIFNSVEKKAGYGYYNYGYESDSK